jgi:FAD/FMN-containing dehydrogenase
MLKRNLLTLSAIFWLISVNTYHNPFSKITPLALVTPTSIEEVCWHIRNAAQNNQKISIAGTQQSRGNQFCSSNGITIDTKALNRILSIDIINKTVTVEAGITWDKLEEALDPLGLSIVTRQSYSNFSVGGSLGVNAHSQNIHDTMLIDSIIQLRIVTADGNVIIASKQQHRDLFYATM